MGFLALMLRLRLLGLLLLLLLGLLLLLLDLLLLLLDLLLLLLSLLLLLQRLLLLLPQLLLFAGFFDRFNCEPGAVLLGDNRREEPHVEVAVPGPAGGGYLPVRDSLAPSFGARCI